MGAAEPGWYDDGTGRLRWWDGSIWTEHYVDTRLGDLELRTDPSPRPVSPTAPGWYDDKRGRLRWWDGRRWTSQTRFSDDHQTLGELTVDGRWVHYRDESQPIAGAVAALEPGAKVSARSNSSRIGSVSVVFGPLGRMTGTKFRRRVHPTELLVAVDGPEQFWVVPVVPGREAEAREFVAWINTSSQHYLARD